uniref:Uncharacterized protein n=1 Tax=Anguilla anguilla TaxID=7936 RepID=A0A0E9PZJ9_ANGAN
MFVYTYQRTAYQPYYRVLNARESVSPKNLLSRGHHCSLSPNSLVTGEW